MSRGAVLITTHALGGRAAEILKEAGLTPVFTEKGCDDSALICAAREAEAQHGPVLGAVSRTLRFGPEVLAELPSLKIISKHGAGVDNIDVDAAKAKNIAVARASGANARAVAEHALTLMLALARHLPALARTTAEGEWERNRWTGEQLDRKTLGLIGFGLIGRQLAGMGRALCREVLVFDPFADVKEIEAAGARPATLKEVRGGADILSLHCPLTPETREMINAEFLAAMRPGAMIINTARGGVIDEAALLAALESGHIGGAGLDSLVNEAPEITPLRQHPSVIVTPHIGGSTKQAMEIVAERAAQNVVDFLDGKELAKGDRIG